MENTNVEEESSDAAAYGLVALCDSNFEGNENQSAEEIVQTSDQIVAELVDQNAVQFFIQNIQEQQQILQEKQGDEQQQQKQEEGTSSEIIVEEVDMKDASSHQLLEFDSSAIAIVQGDENEAIDLESLQAVAEAMEKSGVKVKVETSTGQILTTLENIGMEKDECRLEIAEQQPQEGDVIIDSIQDEDPKVMVSYQIDVLDENYLRALKSRQALMREAVEWKVYARMLLEKGCSEGANFHEPEVFSVLKATDDVVLKAEILARITEKDMLQPAVQFWDFEKVFQMMGQKRSLNCPSCSTSMTFVPFGQRFALRMLYDVDRPVLLVTSFLRCSSRGKKQHEILGYDPRLLRMFPNLELPFMLFHKAGITKKMMDFILESIISGMTVNRLFDIIKAKYEVNHTITSQFFANEIDTIRAHVVAEGGQIEISSDAMFPPYVNCHPSKALLGRCFLAAFKEKDEHFKHCMQQLLANECIILDDSLSVGARIGLPGVWGNAVKMFPEEFQGMFLVFNEAKHILSWTFLKEGKFYEVEGILNELRLRHQNANASLKACFTTKCCTWRDELRQIFGKWFIVKGNLRLFLDQIIKEMPPDHTYYQDCVNELILIFRESNDSEETRKEYTPDPVIIAHNLQEFMKRWRDVIDDRIQAVLTEKALELLGELEQHVQGGCLSGIPPEVGDENFSEIHNALRKSVSHCRITIPLVSALFSMCLHEVNRGKGAPTDFPYDVKQKVSLSSGIAETVGSTSNGSGTNPLDGVSTVSVQTEQDENVVVPSVVQPLLVEKQQIIQAANLIQKVEEFRKANRTEVSILLMQALMYYKYQEDFDAFAPQLIPNLRLLPYYSSALNLISHPAFPREPKNFDTKTICTGLLQTEQKLRRLHIDVGGTARLSGTPNDLFMVISRQMQKDKMSDNLSADVLEYLKHLLALGVHLIDMKEPDIIQSLKMLVDFKNPNNDIENAKQELLSSVNKSLRADSSTTKNTVVKESSNLSANTDQGIALSSITSTENKGQEFLNNSLNFPEEPSDGASSENTDQPNDAATQTADANTFIVQIKLEPDKKADYEVKEFKVEVDEMDVDEISSTKENQETLTKESQEENLEAVAKTGNQDAEMAVVPVAQDDEFGLLKTLADKLGSIITLFTDLEHCWVIPIFPEKYNPYSPHFFVVYRFQRFFAAWLSNKSSVSTIRNINMKRQGKEPQCRCGRGTPGKTGQGRCVSMENGKYLTRCICFRLDRGCGSLCDCRGCENPFGKRPERVRVKKAKIPYRQRYAHEAAKIATCKSSSISTTIATQTPSAPEVVDADIGMESWVPLEHCIFEALINEIKSDDTVITPNEVQNMYNDVIKEIYAMPGLSKVAYEKTTEQIALKLQQREKDVSEYLRIYQMQVDLSLG